MHVVAKSMDDIYRQLCGKLMLHGEDVAGTRELRNAGFTLLDITDNIAGVRKPSISYLLGELTWYFTGRADLEFISKFSSFWSKISDDGETCRSAYGDIVFNRYGFDQVRQVIRILSEDKTSRRAIINFNVPHPDRMSLKDEICTIALVFELRNNALDCTCMMRSNDVWLGVPYDVVFFTELQKYIARQLGVHYGHYTHFAVSLHAYERDLESVKDAWHSSKPSIKMEFDGVQFLTHLSEFEKLADTALNPKKAVIARANELHVIKEVSR